MTKLPSKFPEPKNLLKMAEQESAMPSQTKSKAIIETYYDVILHLRKEKNFQWKQIIAFLKKNGGIELKQSSLATIFNNILRDK